MLFLVGAAFHVVSGYTDPQDGNIIFLAYLFFLILELGMILFKLFVHNWLVVPYRTNVG